MRPCSFLLDRAFCLRIVLVGVLFFWVGCTVLFLVGCTVDVDNQLIADEGAEIVGRGEYLVESVAACGACHGAWRAPLAPLSGGMAFVDRYGEVLAPNITPSRKYGIGKWTANDLKVLFRTHRSRSARYVSHQAHEGLEWLSDRDVIAIAVYLATLKPVHKKVARRDISDYNPTNWTVFESAINVTGVVPDIARTESVHYGHYLARSVMRCQSCHDGVSTWFGDVKAFDGGRMVKRGNQVKKVPSLTRVFGKGGSSWSVADLQHYLRTGLGPDGNKRDAEFCPTNFFARASQEDLVAVVQYVALMSSED